jgi:hypothetical protein
VFVSDLFKINQHEYKSKIVNDPKNLDGNISFHHILSFPVWAAIVRISVISTDVYFDHFIGAMDDVHRHTVH